MTEILKGRIWVDLSKVTGFEAVGDRSILHIEGEIFEWNMSPQLALAEIERQKRATSRTVQIP